jgi:hypothetical protein
MVQLKRTWTKAKMFKMLGIAYWLFMRDMMLVMPRSNEPVQLYQSQYGPETQQFTLLTITVLNM